MPYGRNCGKSRNGKSNKTLKDETSDLPVDMLLDRVGSFDLKLIRNKQTSCPDFNDRIICMYVRGMSTRDIQDHVENLYEVAISPELVSRIIDIVTDEVSAWQSRYQDVVYPNLFLNALFVKIRDLSSIRNKPVYLALGVNLNGDKEQLDLWILKYEGTKFWLNVLNELKNRGVNEISSPVTRAFPAFPRP